MSAGRKAGVEWLPVVDTPPNFLERIRLLSETFPSGVGQLCQFAGANAAALRAL